MGTGSENVVLWPKHQVKWCDVRFMSATEGYAEMMIRCAVPRIFSGSGTADIFSRFFCLRASRPSSFSLRFSATAPALSVPIPRTFCSISLCIVPHQTDRWRVEDLRGRRGGRGLGNQNLVRELIQHGPFAFGCRGIEYRRGGGVLLRDDLHLRNPGLGHLRRPSAGQATA